ncbi:MAG TPA: hypothetical protein VMW25_00645 [Clostridia bacterium]|nr:hypothetical protein [Clostridia bacterium]
MIQALAFTIIKLLFFSPLAILVLFLPGMFLLGKRGGELEPEAESLLSFVLGIVLFSSAAVLLGVLKLRFLSLPLIAGIDFLLLRKSSFKSILSPLLSLLKNKILIGLIILGIFVQGMINFPSGFRYPGGYYFWSAHGHDGLWHVAVMQEIARHFPPNNPLYANQPLLNYHYASNIFMGEFYRLFPFLGSLDLYFRFFPILLSFLISLSVFCFAKKRWNQRVGYWSVFFTYACGSFGYIVSILNHRFPLSGETTFWASQGNTILGNPPYALGIILLTTILFVLELWIKTKENFWLYLIAFLGYGLAVVKVSSGVVAVFALGMSGLYLWWRERKIGLLASGVFLAASNFGLLKLISPTAGSFLIFEPLWFTRTMMVSKLGNVDWELRRQHYLWKNSWHSLLRVVQLELEAIAIFIIGNSGMRIIGFWELIKNVGRGWLKKIDGVDIFIASSLLFSVGFVLLFVQRGIIYNLIQFIQIYLHFLGILAAATTVALLGKLKSRSVRLAISTLVIILAVPTVIGNFFDFYGPGKGPLSKVTPAEEEALGWLKNNSTPEEVVLSKPFVGDGEWRYPKQPWPISAWYSTAYIFVFSNRYAYLTGEEQLMITGYKTEEDLKQMRSFFDQTNLLLGRAFLKDKKISYIYVRKDELKSPLLEKQNGIRKVFENEEALIYRVI